MSQIRAAIISFRKKFKKSDIYFVLNYCLNLSTALSVFLKAAIKFQAKNNKISAFCLKGSLIGIINPAPASLPFHISSKGTNREEII